MTDIDGRFVLWFDDEQATDISRVGGKNSSLAEMTRTLVPAGINVPPGFAVTAGAYWRFMRANDLESPVSERLAAWKAGTLTLHETGSQIRRLLRSASIPNDVRDAIVDGDSELCRRCAITLTSVAVRSSATAEDLPEVSFAGQQESFLNIRRRGRGP